MTRLVVSSEALVRFVDGSVVVLAGGQAARFAETGAVLAILNHFREPGSPDDLPDSIGSEGGGIIASLVEMGALTPYAPDPSRDPAVMAGSLDASGKHLAAIANGAYRLSGDLAAFGPYAHEKLQQKRGYLVGSRLGLIRSALDALREDLRELRPDYVNEQFARLGITKESRGLKLNLAAGGKPLADWINVDLYPAPLAVDMRWSLPFAAGAADFVFFSHALEHFFYPGEAQYVMREIHRVLAPGGVVRIVAPDIEQCIRAYIERNDEFFKSRKNTWHWWPETATRLEDFLGYAGAGPLPSFFFQSHKFGYDFETLQHLLQVCGFQRIKRSAYMESIYPELRVDDASLVAGATYGEGHYSLFVEASS